MIVTGSSITEIRQVKIKFPRKKKKKLKNNGLYPQFVQVIQISNTATANINNVVLTGSKK